MTPTTTHALALDWSTDRTEAVRFALDTVLDPTVDGVKMPLGTKAGDLLGVDWFRDDIELTSRQIDAVDVLLGQAVGLIGLLILHARTGAGPRPYAELVAIQSEVWAALTDIRTQYDESRERNHR